MASSEKQSDISEFYLACRNGDIDFVKDYLKKLSDTDWNSNNFEQGVQSTPLHAASFYGHTEIVQLLLEHGCDRSKVNRYGLTAYEEAANDEVRRLFKRPTNDSDTHRFHDENIADCFDIVERPKEHPEESTAPVATPKRKTKKKPTLYRYKTKAEKQREVGYATTSIAMAQSRLGRLIADAFQRNAPMSLKSISSRLQEIIEKEVIANKDPQSQKAYELLLQYSNNSKSSDTAIEYLIRLYTLETKFYRALRHNPMPLALPLYMVISKLKNRYFQGLSYRGAKMDDDEIATYQWAVENQGSLLQTRHFSSTSLQRSVAEEFSTGVNKSKDNNSHPNTVLFIFNFPNTCDQAINLGRISDELPALSDFEDEAEVLILPWTLFQVDSVEKDSSSLVYTICLTNVLLPQKGILSSFAWILRHPKGSMARFREHFPENQSESVVQELMKSISISDDSLFKSSL